MTTKDILLLEGIWIKKTYIYLIHGSILQR